MSHVAAVAAVAVIAAVAVEAAVPAAAVIAAAAATGEDDSTTLISYPVIPYLLTFSDMLGKPS